MSMLAVRMDQLREMVEIQSRKGTFDVTPYNHGMANGLRLALSIMSGSGPDYLLEPDTGYTGLGTKALMSKAVKVQPPSPPTVEPPYEPAVDPAPPPISPENLGTIAKPVNEAVAKIGRGVAAVIPPEPTRAAPAKKEIPMAKKPKPAPKKPAKAAAKVKPIAKTKAKAKSVKKAASFKGAVKRGKGSKVRKVRSR